MLYAEQKFHIYAVARPLFSENSNCWTVFFISEKKGYTLNGTVAFLLQMQEVLDSDLTHRPVVLTEVYHGFPESLQANGRVVFSVKAQLFFHDMPKSVFTCHFVI